jgi:hypothetical protein
MHVSNSALLTEIYNFYYASRASPAIKSSFFGNLVQNFLKITEKIVKNRKKIPSILYLVVGSKHRKNP